MFNLNFWDYIFKGNLINDEIIVRWLLYNRYKENILNNNIIWIGEFKKILDKEKELFYFINGIYFKKYWKDDNNIDKNKICKLN